MNEAEWAEAYNDMVDKYEEMLGNLMKRIRRESQYEVKFYVQLSDGMTMFHLGFDNFYEAEDKIYQMGLKGAKVVSRKESPLQEVHVSTKEDQT